MLDLRANPLRLVVFVSLLAACSSATQSPDTADEGSSSGVLGEALTRAVRPGRPVEVSLDAEPLAACHLRAAGVASSAKGLSLAANSRGSVHFFVTRAAHALAADRFVLDCSAQAGNVVRSLEITTDESTTSPTPSAARATPPDGKQRPALTGDLQRFTAEELHALRYPPRPDAEKNPEGYQRWLQIVSHDSFLVDAHPVTAIGEQNNNDDNHVVGFTAGTNANYTRVLATWTIPEVFDTGEDAVSAIWVGLADDAVNTLMQNGTGQNVIQNGGSAIADYYAWSEYYLPGDAGEQRLADFPVSPGDVVTCETWTGDSGGYEQASGQVAWFYFDNLTAGFSTYNSIYPPAGAPSFKAGYAEWFVERHGLVDYPSPLADYAPFTMSSAEASDTTSGVHGFLDAGWVDQYDMKNASGATLSLAVAEASYGGNPESIDFTWYASH
jgi:hypothetical protein